MSAWKVVDKILRTTNIQVLNCPRQILISKRVTKSKPFVLYCPNRIALWVNFKMALTLSPLSVAMVISKNRDSPKLFTVEHQFILFKSF